MNLNIPDYVKSLVDNKISVMYSGPVWADGIDGMAEMLQRRLDIDNLPLNASQSVFSVFVEQMSNILMYSAEKETFSELDNARDLSKGVFILGIKEESYFIYTGNLVGNKNADILKKRIDHLNTLDKKELRKFFRERTHAENDNPESKGAGLGLIEVARRASSKIEYNFEPQDDGMQYFTMYIEI
ncbi:MAG: SiaB family protein kinase [Lachnospiraceae bacterium]|nr:SiaB family protein kinase [Lachnospiraceae bacterium]